MRFGALRKLGPLGVALTAAQVGRVVHDHWRAVPADQRDRLAELLRQTKGRPSKLSAVERRELRQLVRALNVPQVLVRGAITAGLGRRALRRP
jgi:transposase